MYSRHEILNTSHKPSQLTTPGPIEAGETATASSVPVVVNLSVVSKQNPSPARPGEGLWTSPLPYTLHLTSARREKMLEYDKVNKEH